MSLLLIAPDREIAEWEQAIHEIDPNIDINLWPSIEDKERVQFAVVWNQPKHLLDSFPNLKAVSSLGAGVDHLLRDESLPESVDICRVVAPSLVQQMTEYILGAVISIQRNFIHYIRQSDAGTWQVHEHSLTDKISVGIMGLGKLGRPVTQKLSRVGYQVSGWSKSPKDIKGVITYAGSEELKPFLQNTQILICLLPLTPETEDILDLHLFKQLQKPSWIINVARGKHLVDEDLIYALDSDILHGAWLDVFSEEPLPDKHAFWNRDNIIITPHVGSLTKPAEVAGQIVENYKRALSGMELKNQVDREKGY